MVDNGLRGNRPRSARTAHILQPTSGGTPAVALQLVEAELEFGHEVTVAAPFDLKQPVTSLDATYVTLPLRRSPGFYDLRALWEVRKVIKGVDVVVLHSSKAIMLGKFALRSIRRSRRPRSIAVPHSWSWNVGGRMAVLYKILEKRTRNWVDVVVCVSQFEEAQGRSVLGTYPSIIIRNAVNIEKFRPTEKSSPRKDCRLLIVGRLSQQKGQDFFIPLMAEIQGARLSLVGEGPDRKALEDLVHCLGLESRITFLGECDVTEHYGQSDIVVMPSRWEGLSLVLLEAMASGLPIVASKAAAGDFNETHGVTVAELSDKSFQESVALLVENPSRRMELGHLARQAAEELLDIRFRNNQWLKLITMLSASVDGHPHSLKSIDEIHVEVGSKRIGGNGVS